MHTSLHTTEFHAATQRALDLTQLPLVNDRALWALPDDYTATQLLANNARQASAEVIRYESVRFPEGHCLAILFPEVFRSVAEPFRNNQQTWSLLINPPHQVVWQRELSQECWAFDF